MVLQLRSFELSTEVDAESLTVYKGGGGTENVRAV